MAGSLQYVLHRSEEERCEEVIPDNYDLWERHEREKERKLASRPDCKDCGNHIQDDFYFEVEGDILCEECMYDRYCKDVTDDGW